MKWYQKVDWPATLFLTLTPLLALTLTPIYVAFDGGNWMIWAFALIFAAATNLSITAGYHRLFAHRSYEAHPIVRALFLLVGASAWQGTALKWSTDHRIHHSKVDTDDDPYSINKGFWYAHMGWLFLKETRNENPKAPDLERDWMLMFQHKYYVWIAILMGFGFPTLVGWGLGSTWGGFLIGGALRIVLTQQSTFFVNSLCHTLGKQTYSDQVTARDSIIVALLTHGEGYHNFHHQFQIDYRNGIRWYQWDPTKWTIRLLSILGLAKKLRTISDHEILKAKLKMDAIRLQAKGFSADRAEEIQQRIIQAQDKWKRLKFDYIELKNNIHKNSVQKKEQVKLELKLAKLEFQYALKQWQLYTEVRS